MLLLHILKKGIREFVVGLPPFLASASSNLVAFATAQFRLGPRHFVGSVTRSFLSWVLQCVTGMTYGTTHAILCNIDGQSPRTGQLILKQDQDELRLAVAPPAAMRREFILSDLTFSTSLQSFRPNSSLDKVLFYASPEILSEIQALGMAKVFTMRDARPLNPQPRNADPRATLQASFDALLSAGDSLSATSHLLIYIAYYCI